jgi:hypothetical protein
VAAIFLGGWYVQGLRAEKAKQASQIADLSGQLQDVREARARDARTLSQAQAAQAAAEAQYRKAKDDLNAAYTDAAAAAWAATRLPDGVRAALQ